VSAVLARAQSTQATIEPVAEPGAEQAAQPEPILISSSSEVLGSVLSDTIVQRNCTLHVRGNLLGRLIIEPGASVVVDGSVDGRIINKGGRLQVHNKGLAACVTVEGPPEAEAGGVLKINLTNLAANYEKLAKRTEAECAAVVRADGYGCGIRSTTHAMSGSSKCFTSCAGSIAAFRPRLRIRPAFSWEAPSSGFPHTTNICTLHRGFWDRRASTEWRRSS
jgi:hypothetical protein